MSHPVRNIPGLGQFLRCPSFQTTKDVVKKSIIAGVGEANGKKKFVKIFTVTLGSREERK